MNAMNERLPEKVQKKIDYWLIKTKKLQQNKNNQKSKMGKK